MYEKAYFVQYAATEQIPGKSGSPSSLCCDWERLQWAWLLL
jgi:hypothetical protein